MHHRYHIFLLGFFISILIFNGCTTEKENENQKPNILLILADDLGYNDLGFQGSEDLRTPNIDKLSKNGIIFNNAHVSASVCSPSRAGLLTGRYQQFFGHEANVPPPHTGMDTNQLTMADLLKSNGYSTSINGKWHLGVLPEYHPNNRGFDHFWGFLGGHRDYFPNDYPEGHPKAMYTNQEFTPFNGKYLTDAQGDSAVAFIDRTDENPFFMFLSFAAPHAPMHALEEDMALFPDTDRPEYAAMVWAMDRAVGKIVDKLEETGNFDNTLIVFLSDNGGSPVNDSDNSPLKGFKGNKFEGGLRVPFLVHWPNQFNGGHMFEGLSSSLDLFPTFLAAAGVQKPEDLLLDGVNLLPYLNEEVEGDPHDQLFFRKEMAAAVIDAEGSKLIRLDDYGYVLYDLENDPYETNDLFTQSPELAESMINALEQWETKTVIPWWSESNMWQQVTIDIHKDLMSNQPVRRISP